MKGNGRPLQGSTPLTSLRWEEPALLILLDTVETTLEWEQTHTHTHTVMQTQAAAALLLFHVYVRTGVGREGCEWWLLLGNATLFIYLFFFFFLATKKMKK